MGPLSRTALDEEIRLGVEEEEFDDEDAGLEDEELDLDDDDVDYDPAENPDTDPPASGDRP